MRKLWVSISGGRTSAYMSIKLKQYYSDRYDLIFLYANTGLEDEETLRFINRIDKIFDLNIIWIESVAHKKRGKSSTHKLVNFETACRDGELFERMIKVYGIPNISFPHCTRELKINPMQSYIKEIGWSKEYRAIGIRADEPRRIPKKSSVERKIYPLVDFFRTEKDDVIEFFKGKDYDLKIPEHRGNCVTCWKKSDKKIMRLIKDDVSEFDFFKKMEEENGLCGHNIFGTKRTFFRKKRSVKDMIKLTDLMKPDNIEHSDRCANEECGIE